MNILVKSAIAGFIATVPMTIFMTYVFKKLPHDEKYPLPPRKITLNVAEKAGIEPKLDESQKMALTMFGHFSFGAAAGSLFFPLVKFFSIPKYLGGIGYGLLVWSTSYLGWLPLVKLHQSATKMPMGRNALMIGAHIVWGGVLSFLYSYKRRTL